MWLLLLEAGLAVSLLIFFVWWTMISGKKPDHSQSQKPLTPLLPRDEQRDNKDSQRD